MAAQCWRRCHTVPLIGQGQERRKFNCIGGSAKHDIALDGANPSVQVNDLRAYNANKKRTGTYDGTYGLYDGPDESPNNQSIQVVGKGHASHGDR